MLFEALRSAVPWSVCRWSRFVAVVVSGMNHYWSAHKAIVLYASISSGQSMKHYSFASTFELDAPFSFRKGWKVHVVKMLYISYRVIRNLLYASYPICNGANILDTL